MFTALPHELSAKIIAQMPTDSLARLALSSKRLSTRVAERVADKALWDSLIPLVEEANHLWTVVKNQQIDEYRGMQMDTFMRLLAHIKEVCPGTEHVIDRMEAHLLETQMDTTCWKYHRLFRSTAGMGIVTLVKNLLDDKLERCVAACSVAMKPEQLMTFAADVTKASSKMWDDPSWRPEYLEERCIVWCRTMRMAIRTSVHRLDWSPQLAIGLAKRAPHYKAVKDSKGLIASLVAAVPLSSQVVEACAHSSDLALKDASAVVLAFINKSFTRLHEDELGELGLDEGDLEEYHMDYYEEDYGQHAYIKDRGQVFLDVARQIMPPVELSLQLLRALIEEDKSRHFNIEDDYDNGFYDGSPDYDQFVGTRIFVAGWVSSLNFTSLSRKESEALASGLASFQNRDVKACLVPVALEWIKALVQPLKEAGRRSNKKDAELVKSIEQICQAILVGSSS